MPLIMNDLGEFVDPEPEPAYLNLTRIMPREAIRGHEKHVYHRTCPACGRRFDTTRKNKEYCSPACCNLAYRRRRAER